MNLGIQNVFLRYIYKLQLIISLHISTFNISLTFNEARLTRQYAEISFTAIFGFVDIKKYLKRDMIAYTFLMKNRKTNYNVHHIPTYLCTYI